MKDPEGDAALKRVRACGFSAVKRGSCLLVNAQTGYDVRYVMISTALVEPDIQALIEGLFRR
jgi:hypothetical protein